MVKAIRDLLADSELLVNQIMQADEEVKGYTISKSREPYLKWNDSAGARPEEAFVFLLFQWLKVQKEDYPDSIKENENKPEQALLTELFGTLDFSQLETERIKDKSFVSMILEHLISGYTDRKVYLQEYNSLKYITGIRIRCKTGNVLYFGKTRRFYFLVSERFLRTIPLPVYKDIYQLLFRPEYRESVRKRPGMFFGSTDMPGVCRLLSEVIENILEDAKEKVISLKVMPDFVYEVNCESYSIKANSLYYTHWAIVSSLSEYFIYQDQDEMIRTETGILKETDRINTVAAGIRIVWKLDQSIYMKIKPDYYMVLNRMIELATLNPYTIYLSDQNNQNKICIPSGIESILTKNIHGLIRNSSIISCDFAGDGFSGKAVISFCALSAEIRESYVNNLFTIEGGTHVDGVMRGAGKALQKILDSYEDTSPLGEILERMNYVVNMRIDKAKYYGATKRKIRNMEVGPVIQKMVEDSLFTCLNEDIEPLRSIYMHRFTKRI